MTQTEAFLKDLDGQWKGPGKVRLPIIGSAALFLQTNYDRGTKDSDVWETPALTQEVKEGLLKAAGKGSPLHHKHRIYLDIVINGLPFLPQSPRFHALASINRSLKRFHVEVLDVVDVSVSKLARFKPDDIADISAMVKGGHVPHKKLLDRFQSALEASSLGAEADSFSKYIKNFHTVERDLYHLPESEIDPPSWAG